MSRSERPTSARPTAARLLRLLGMIGALAALLAPATAGAQGGPKVVKAGPKAKFGPRPTIAPSAASDDEPSDDPPSDPDPEPPRVHGGGTPADFPGALQTLRAPGTGPSAGLSRLPEIFPDASRVWMSVRDTDPLPIETARRGGPWLCANGQCTATNGDAGQTSIGDRMLRSIKLQTPTLPLPLTIWRRVEERGVLDFDPVLLDRRDYRHVCAYRPIDVPDPKAPPAAPTSTGAKKAEKVPICHDGPAALPTPNAGEITLGLEWPRQSELADWRYLAIVDSCGNARVQPFQRTFTVPVFEVASGGCGQPDGKVLRVFPQGGWIRVTAFNLDAPAAANVVNATYRVTIPPLEDAVEGTPARLLFPDPSLEDLKVDCGPIARRAPTDFQGIPQGPPGSGHNTGPTYEVPPDAAPPKPPEGPALKPPAEEEDLVGKSAGAAPPAAGAAAPPAAKGAPPGAKPPATPPPGAKPPGPPGAPSKPLAPTLPPPRALEAPSGPGPQPLANQGVVIAPEPLRQGICRVRLLGQTKRRLVAPLALFVSLTRTDRTINGAPIEMLTDGKWIVTPNAAEFQLPPLAENFDGDSRLRLVVSSDPLSANGKVVLLSDAGRVASSLRSGESGEEERARRIVGTVIIHSVPLCGSSNFEGVETVGSCIRAYITIPAMLATIQLTRAPWVERPLITRTVLSAVGVALAFDSYNPVQHKAFPIAGQIGGFVQSLGDGRLGMLGYLGIAPTLPVLGEGGNTTSFGFLAGIGVEYISNEAGPNEGVKPAAFASIVVQVGQVNPAFSGSAKGSVSASGGF